MAWAKGKTIIYKLLVFAVNGSLYNPVSTIKIIIKNRVANMLHVHTYLVCAAGFQPACVTKTFLASINVSIYA